MFAIEICFSSKVLDQINLFQKKNNSSFFSWFFENVSRKEADKLLLAEENPRGTFLVRPSEHNPNGFSLSVKDWEDGRGYHVKHYKIKPLDNGGYYIATNQTFPSLQALVLAYSSEYHQLKTKKKNLRNYGF